MPYNIFVLGLDELGIAELATLPDAYDYVFHGLFTIEELQSGTIDLEEQTKLRLTLAIRN